MKDQRVHQILEFWRQIGPKGWFRRDDAIDGQIRETFSPVHEDAAKDRLDGWLAGPDSCLALLLVLDQFPRNMFRDDPRAFASDPKAVTVTREAIALGRDLEIGPEMRPFVYMPLMHSESIIDQDDCVALMHRHGADDHVKYARIHRDIIARFGRFPHRNKVLGRHTTPAEQDFLDAGGFSA